MYLLSLLIFILRLLINTGWIDTRGSLFWASKPRRRVLHRIWVKLRRIVHLKFLLLLRLGFFEVRWFLRSIVKKVILKHRPLLVRILATTRAAWILVDGQPTFLCLWLKQWQSITSSFPPVAAHVVNERTALNLRPGHLTANIAQTILSLLQKVLELLVIDDAGCETMSLIRVHLRWSVFRWHANLLEDAINIVLGLFKLSVFVDLKNRDL